MVIWGGQLLAVALPMDHTDPHLSGSSKLLIVDMHVRTAGKHERVNFTYLIIIVP